MPKPRVNGPTKWDPANLTMPVGVDALMSMTQPAFAAMADFNSKLFDNAAQVSAEWTEFLGRRLQEDMEVPQRLAVCKTPQDAQQVWADYWKTTFEQYQEELGRLTKMGQSFAQQTTSAVQKQTEALIQEREAAA